MKRLTSLLTLLITLSLGFVATPTTQAKDGKQLLELRTYTFASAEKKAAFAEFAADTLIPALNRAGVKPVGLFGQFAADNIKKGDAPSEPQPEVLELVMVLPFNNAETMINLARTLDADQEYQKAGKAIITSTKKDAAYLRVQSSMMLSFDGVPKVEVPNMEASRVLQLRIYESANEDRALRKVEMFNEGELEIFREVGMDPVFFGQVIAGSNIPNLTYMLSFKNDQDLKANWQKFLKHPKWAEMKGNKKYADTVSKIHNVVLRPIKGSQI